MLIACGSSEKGPAEMALKAAEEAVNATKAEIAKIAPDLVNSLENALASAKEKFNKKDFKAALEEAKALPAKAKEVLDAAKARTGELTKKWEEYSREIPKLMENLQGKVDALSKNAKLPADLTGDKFNEVKSWVSSASEEWAKALESFKAGSLAEAVTLAAAVKEKALKATEAFGADASAAASM
ncbi:MAG TPA: hypothetical protein PK425_12040 [Syntrophales bacterium]|nr:hypothetical protein [Syntrophales bacterium]